MLKAVHYINQFFGQVGGEESADFEPVLQEGPVGPGLLLNEAMKEVKITHTVICGTTSWHLILRKQSLGF